MPIQFNDAGLLTGLDAFLARIEAGADNGLETGASLMQEALETTGAHGDITGATRASYRAYVIGPNRDGSAEAQSGYDAAQEHISSYSKHGLSGHGGQALKQDSGVILKSDERGIIETAFTDYQDKLEIDNAGDKATLGPTLQAFAQTVTALVANGIRNELR